jgi:HEAT repeat protein
LLIGAIALLLAIGMLARMSWQGGMPEVAAGPKVPEVAPPTAVVVHEMPAGLGVEPIPAHQGSDEEQSPSEVAPDLVPTDGEDVAQPPEEIETAKADDPPAAEPRAPAIELEAPSPPTTIKRRRQFSEQDLRKQLAAMPEIRSLTMESMATLVHSYKQSFEVSRGDWNGALEPTPLLQRRPDLAQLPVRSGSACRLNRQAAATLEFLSRKLRIYVETAVNRDTKDGRPDPKRLRETLQTERRGRRAEWLRPEAIPVLLQLLMHEDGAIRQVLVEVLAEIGGKAASTALAQRAVFDLAPEVRRAAILALASRPRPDYRHVFLQALRYPWPPVADHAAEALAALEDHDAVPALVAMLKKPDPTAPIPVTGKWPVVQEVVRINHRINCLMCHAPAVKGSDPVPGMVPGVSLQLPESSQRMVAMCRETGRVVVNPLLVRADVTFMRQDFSVRQPVLAAGALAAEELRFDYLVRARPIRSEELGAGRSRPKVSASYEQREAVLFALRELSGQDVGPTAEAWQQLFPHAQATAEAARLATALVRAMGSAKERLLEQYKKEGKPQYTRALALAVPRLKGGYRDKAREILVDKLAQAPDNLGAAFRDEDAEIRRAAASACARNDMKNHIPDLIELLEDSEVAVVDAADRALRRLTGADVGLATGKDRARVIAAWKAWGVENVNNVRSGGEYH